MDIFNIFLEKIYLGLNYIKITVLVVFLVQNLILGSYLARFFPILFGLFIFLETKKKNKLLLFVITIIFILSEGLIFLSGERLALFFMNLSAIYIILMIKEYKIYRLWTYVESH